MAFFKDMESEDKQAKHECLVDSWQNQWLGLMFLAKAHVIPDQNNLSDHEGVNQRGSIDEIRDVELVEQQHAVGCQSTKEKGQVKEDYGKFLELVSRLLFQAGFVGIFIAHLALQFFVRPALQAFVVPTPK
jgi:hypothetical protein